GIVELTELLASRGVGAEACLFTVDDAELLVRRGEVERYRRIVVEPMEADPAAGCEHALAMEAVLLRAEIRLEQVHHGMGPASWPVLRQAVTRGHGIRTGLEDVADLPDGGPADGNLALVRAAAELL
ncbi:3-keto-5-aminohexanoate cleavage protein, partial [Aeromicrobium alkaliterrae]